MKKRKHSLTFIVLLSSLVVVIIITSLLIFVKRDKFNDAFFNILYEINKALILTTIFGTITKLISDEIFKVKTNDTKMRQLGIHSIGEGKLDKKQTRIMFGGKGYEYPSELKFCFISGVVFIKVFTKNIIEAIKNGCHVKILIADPIKSHDYLARANTVNNQNGEYGSYIDQCHTTIQMVEEIRNYIKEHDLTGSIEVRHYIDEYRYNFRIAKFYHNLNDEVIKAWINFQPINKNAIDQSLTVIGNYDEEYLKDTNSRVSRESNNIVLSLDESFDMLWDIYKK
jgi:hypothetical protein